MIGLTERYAFTLTTLLLTHAEVGYRVQTGGVRLVNHLLDPLRYNAHVRPVRNASTPVVVKHRMNLYQILDVNEPQQNVALYVWITQYWSDGFLGWRPEEFEGISNIVLPYNTVWLPDTVLYNSVEMVRDNAERYISVIYTTDSNGTQASAIFQYPAIYRFTCRMDIFYFPFDTQNCTLTFSSWVYDAAGIEYFPFREEVTYESYVENEEWEVRSFRYDKEVISYQCCPVPWTLIHIHLIIKRKSLYYISNLILPTGIITFIAIVGFFTPSTTSMERTEKVNLGINTLLAMSILLLMVSDQMPTTSNFIPLMGWFFLTIIVHISVGTLISSIIMGIQQQAAYGKRVPTWVQWLFFKKIAAYVCMKPGQELAALMIINRDTANVANSPGTKRYAISARTDASGRVPPISLAFSNSGCEEKRKGIEEEEMGEIEEDGLMKLEWQYLASILDRIFLILFGFSVSFVTMGMLMIDVIFNP